jgi:hypothetical protein
VHFFRGQPSGDITCCQKPTRRNEPVYQVKKATYIEISKKKIRSTKFWKTPLAANRFRFITKMAISVSHHLSVVVTNRKIFVQRKEYFAVWESSPDVQKDFNAKIDKVMKVNDVWFQLFE